jgi:hypothetical protein
LLEELIRPPHRLLVCVEDATIAAFEHDDVTSNGGEGNGTLAYYPGRESLRVIVKKADPPGIRTLHVYNKVSSVLDSFTSPSQLQRFLAHTTEAVGSTMWCSLLASKEREASRKGNYLTRLSQVEARDATSLALLQCGPKHTDFVGLPRVRRYIVEWAWKRYCQDELLKLNKIILAKKTELEQQIQEVSSLMNAGLNLKGNEPSDLCNS